MCLSNKVIYKECNSKKIDEYCISIIAFSGQKGHMKVKHPEINLHRGVYSASDIKQVDEEVKENPVNNNNNVETNSSRGSNCKYYIMVNKLMENCLNAYKILEN